MGNDYSVPESMEFTQILGKGKFSEVYEGSFTDPRDNTHYDSVAIKVLQLGYNSNTSRKKAREEVSIVQKILKSKFYNSISKEDSPIVRLIAIGESSDKVYIIMEKLDGDGIQFEKFIQKLKDKDNFDEVLLILRKNLINLCKGLSAVHKNCVIHRDIKPDNLLYNKNTSLLKLADFGLSCLYSECSKGLVGTMNYMEPMCMLGYVYNPKKVDCVINHFSDIFSLGMTFYYFLSGSNLLQQNTTSYEEYIESLKKVNEVLTDYGKRSDEWNIFTTCLKNMISLFHIKRPTPLQCIEYLETGDIKKLISVDANIEKDLYNYEMKNCK